MNLWHLSLLFLHNHAFAIQTDPDKDFYYAAVVEYSPMEGIDGNDTVLKNGREFVRLIQRAAEVADIVVFPETAINFEDVTVYLDAPFGNNFIAPADNTSLHPVLQLLSKAARDNQVYVSVCILEKDETSSNKVMRYNTNVVFDRKGVIVSRYRKFNLYAEESIYLNPPKVPEVAFFDTDFGVRFGVFICADIFYKDPALTLVYGQNITDIIYPSWPLAELQFLAIQIQFGWAYMTDSNLLSAGINSMEQGSTGSGLFAGKKGPVVYIISERNQTVILTAKLYKNGKVGQPEGKILEPLNEGFDASLSVKPDDFQHYQTHLLTPELRNESLLRSASVEHELVFNKTFTKTICQASLCCEFFINASFTYQPQEYLNMQDISYVKNDSSYHYQYRLAVFDGIRGFTNSTSAGIQVCAIISCLNGSLSSCGEKSGNIVPLKINSELYGNIFLYSTAFNDISIKAVTKEKTDFTFPNILESSTSQSPKAYGSLPDVSKLDFSSDGFTSMLNFSSSKLIYTAIYSRIVSRDGKNVGVSSDHK